MKTPYLTITDQHYVLDIEGDDLDATTIWCAYAYHLTSDTWFELVGEDELRDFIAARPGAIWVGHNILSWDIPTIRKLLGTVVGFEQIVDTLILGQLYWPKIPRPPGLSPKKGPHSLEAWGLRFGVPKGEFSDFSKLTPEMLVYCKQDVNITVRLYRTLVERMTKRGYTELSCWVEHGFREVVNKQEANGFWFDTTAAEELFRRLRNEERELGDRIRQVFQPEQIEVGTYKYRTTKEGRPHATFLRHSLEYGEALHFNDDGTYTLWGTREFNIGSPSQRLKRMLDLGYKPTKLTKTGNPSIDEDSLVEFAKESGIEEVGLMADWLVANGRANMIGTWLNSVKPDSRIHGSVWTCGAATRRCTHSNPNSANIPGDGAKYGHECRELWGIPKANRKTRKLVGVDAKALEMRMFAHYLGNKEAADLYCFGDPHQVNADLLGILRKTVKNVFYAFLYGASDGKISTTAGFPKNSGWGKKARKKLKDGTPGLKELTDQLTEEFKTGFIETIDGGFVRCLSEHAALNYKLQSAGAILMKVAAILMDQEIVSRNWDVYWCGNIHDEWQLDAPAEIAEEVGTVAADCIKRAGVLLGFSVETDGDYKIGDTWADTH